MKNVKSFILKKDFPGGYKKGDIITNRGTGIWYWDKTQAVCPYDPTKEPDFFEEVIITKYLKDNKVFLTPAAIRKHGIRGIGHKTEVTVSNVRRYVTGVKYEIKNGNKIICTVNESDIYIPTVYWFINSKGAVCQDVVEFSEKHVYAYRVAIGNTYITPAEANKALDTIRKGIAYKTIINQ